MNNRTSPHGRAAAPGGAPRAGFTLVELLMVILIIGMLMALLTNAVWEAMRTARRTAISVETGQLATGLEAYKDARGDYPPDMRNPTNAAYQAVVMRHIRQAWPRYPLTSFDAWRADVQSNTGLDPARMRQAEALVFWLGGIWDPGSGTLRGYNANAPTPFAASPRQYLPAYFDFEETRVLPGRRGNWPVYIQRGGSIDTPYVYFAAVPSGNYNQLGPNIYSTRGAGTAHPYLLSKEGPNGQVIPLPVFVKNKSFQIVAAGLDNNFGGPPGNGNYFPHGLGYTDGDRDNVTSFSDGTLGDRIP